MNEKLTHYEWLGRLAQDDACTKSGMHADIPYVRVWAGDVCLAEFCQHQIVGVYFSASPTK